MSTIKGPGEARKYDGSSLRVGILHARWNTQIIDPLVAGALATLQSHGVKPQNITVQTVPGSYELPMAVRQMYTASQTQSSAIPGGGLVSAATDLLGGSGASREDLSKMGQSSAGGAGADGDADASKQPFDAIIAIGALIKGSTMHFEYISDAVSHGLMRVQLDTGCPVVFGLLTLLDEGQGLMRAGVGGDSGKEGHNHGEDWGAGAVELGLKRRGWAEGKFVE